MRIKPRWILAGGAALFAVGLVINRSHRPKAPEATPPPSERQLRAFVRLAPSVFGPLIAQRERSLRTKIWPSPLGVLLPDGVPVRILGPSLASDDRRESHFGQFWGDGTYIAPPIPGGSAIDSVASYRPHEHHELYVVLAGPKGTSGVSPIGDEALFSDGASVKRDLGPLPYEAGRYLLRAPGSMSDGFGFVIGGGPAPRRIALAPEELPNDAKAEPNGDAVLYDELMLWRKRNSDPTSRIDFYDGLTLPPPVGVLFARRKTVITRIIEYRVTGFAHVYTRRDGRWRYAHSWQLEGSGSAFTTSDDALYLHAPGTSPAHAKPSGVPTALKATGIFPVER